MSTVHTHTEASSFDDEVQSVLAKARSMHLTGIIDEQLATLSIRKLDYFATVSKKPIHIALNTIGGSIHSGLALYDHIVQLRKSGVPITITTKGSCMSMGLIVLQAATKRQTNAHTTFLLHEGSGSTSGTVSQLHEQGKEIKRLTAMCDEILADRSGLTVDKVKGMCRKKDLFLSAQQAVDHNFVDEVV